MVLEYLTLSQVEPLSLLNHLIRVSYFAHFLLPDNFTFSSVRVQFSPKERLQNAKQNKATFQLVRLIDSYKKSLFVLSQLCFTNTFTFEDQ